MSSERLPATATDWLSVPEIREITSRPLSQLLNEAFSALKTELEENGSTQEFLNLRLRYGEQLKAWWQARKEVFFRLKEEEKLINNFGERWARIGEEEILVQQIGVYEREDEQVLIITQKTPLEENKITITASADTGLDVFLYPPKMTSKTRQKVDGDWNTHWEVVFYGPAISTITKATFHDHPDFELPYVKKIETIDASIFGTDRIDGI